MEYSSGHKSYYQQSDSENSILILSKLCNTTVFVHSEQEYLKALWRFLNVLSNVDFGRLSKDGKQTVRVFALSLLVMFDLKHICSSHERWR